MPLVAAPAAERAAIERLPHLPGAGRQDRPFGEMKIEARLLPIEAEKFDQAAAFARKIPDQLLVLDD